jgi:hypothetical protein
MFIFAYMIWDRRTALYPIREKAIDLNEKQKNLIRALREYAKENKDLQIILKNYNLL